jgi:hypothetical protein
MSNFNPVRESKRNTSLISLLSSIAVEISCHCEKVVLETISSVVKVQDQDCSACHGNLVITVADTVKWLTQNVRVFKHVTKSIAVPTVAQLFELPMFSQ